MSSAEAARLICGKDVVSDLDAGQPLFPTSSEIALELVDSGVSAPISVTTSASPRDQMRHTIIALGSRSVRQDWPHLPNPIPSSIVDPIRVEI